MLSRISYPKINFTHSHYKNTLKLAEIEPKAIPVASGVQIEFYPYSTADAFFEQIVDVLHPDLDVKGKKHRSQLANTERERRLIRDGYYSYLNRPHTPMTDRESAKLIYAKTFNLQYDGVIDEIKEKVISLGRKLGLGWVEDYTSDMGITKANIDSNGYVTVTLGEFVKKYRSEEVEFIKDSFVTVMSKLPGYQFGFRDAVIQGAVKIAEKKLLLQALRRNVS